MVTNDVSIGALYTLGYDYQLKFEEKFELGLVCKKINRKEKIKLE